MTVERIRQNDRGRPGLCSIVIELMMTMMMVVLKVLMRSVFLCRDLFHSGREASSPTSQARSFPSQ